MCLRVELNEMVSSKSLLDPEVIKKSQELDIEIVRLQREKIKSNEVKNFMICEGIKNEFY